jgi:hypothetical protein
MTLHVVWEKCSVDNPDTGENLVLNRGEELPDFVTPFVRSTLVQIGAVRDFGAAVSMVQDAADAEQRTYEPVKPPVMADEIPPVTEFNGRPVDLDNGPLDPADAPSAGDSRPSTSDNKETWERYAVARGYFDQAEAESMTKKDLVAAVNERETR